MQGFKKVGGDVEKALVKAGKQQEVKVLNMMMSSDQPWHRVMRREVMEPDLES